MIHHRAEHIYSNLARTLSRLPAIVGERQNGAEVQAEPLPQPVSVPPPAVPVPSPPPVPPVASVPPSPPVPPAPPAAVVQTAPQAVAPPSVTEPLRPVQVPVTQTTNTAGLSYIEAILAIKNGGTIRRLGWSEGISVFVEDGVRILKNTEKDHLPGKVIVDKFTPLVGDVLSNDWEVLPLPNCTFLEAIAALEQGQCVRRASWGARIQIKDNKFCVLDDSQQEYTMRYEDICTPDWEIMYKPTK